MVRRGKSISLGQFCSERGLKSRKARNQAKQVSAKQPLIAPGGYNLLFCFVFSGVFYHSSLSFPSPSLFDPLKMSNYKHLVTGYQTLQQECVGDAERPGGKRTPALRLSPSWDTRGKCLFFCSILPSLASQLLSNFRNLECILYI